ncbi:MAG: YhfC family intramembrane metalloprotease [Firmicutes bacterium]|nr:YhfC family intramembrane metalloprotease [Bacillota bacterium]
MRAFWIGFSCVTVCLIPLICGAVWRKRAGAMRPVGFGILGFFAFSAIVETVFVLFFLSAAGPVTRALNASPLRLVVFSCLCAGFFEEWGRYWIYSNGLQHCEGRGVPIGYAIGHFGAEIVILTVYPLLSRAPELFGAVQAGVVIYERIVACAGHTALSILVWDAFCRRDKKRLAFAVLIHAVCDAPLGMLRYGLLLQGPAELLFGAFVTVLCILALRTWRKMPAGVIIRA